jgi:hypothetical protein
MRIELNWKNWIIIIIITYKVWWGRLCFWHGSRIKFSGNENACSFWTSCWAVPLLEHTKDSRFQRIVLWGNGVRNAICCVWQEPPSGFVSTSAAVLIPLIQFLLRINGQKRGTWKSDICSRILIPRRNILREHKSQNRCSSRKALALYSWTPRFESLSNHR